MPDMRQGCVALNLLEAPTSDDGLVWAGIAPAQPDYSELAEAFDPTPDPYMHDPEGWLEDVLQAELWSKPRDILRSVATNRYTATRSCHGIGKSWTAAHVAAWWLATRPLGDAFVVTTAPTWQQVHAILWREIRRAHAKGGLPGRTTLDARWYMGGARPGAPEEELVAMGRKPADYDQAAFQGIHALYVLVLIDEASGIPKLLYDAVDSLATNEHSRVLAIGNPDDPASEFANISKPGSGWNAIQVGYADTPNFTGESVSERLSQLLISKTWVEERKQRWGETSPTYIAKVLGEFPDVSDDTLLSPAVLRACTQLELPGRAKGQYGGDVARFGDDETVLYRNRGGQIRFIWGAHKLDTVETTNHFYKYVDRHKGGVPIVVDGVGLGSGVVDNLKHQRQPVMDYNGGMAPIDGNRFGNRRAEDYWTFKDMCEAGEVDLDPDDLDLLAQLGAVKWRLGVRGKIYIESKEEMKKRGLPSPDRADAVVMTTVNPDVVHVPERDEQAVPKGTDPDIMTQEW